jgi:hypothetical protein
MAKESTSGLMAESTTDNGSTTKWKEMAHSRGPMAVDMLECTKTIKSTDKELSNGQMVASTSVNGAKENNMEKVFTSKKAKRDKEFGTWAKERSGSVTPREQQTSDDKNKIM